MSLLRYPKYKDSGAAWLGEVPEHWTVKRFKWLIERNDGGVWGEEPDGEGDTIVLRSTEQTVDGRWKLDEPASRKLTESEKLSAILSVGDLLVTKSSGSSLHIGKTTLVDEQIASLTCCYSNFMQRIRLTKGVLPKLAWYVMNNDLVRVQFDLLSNSTTGLANLNGAMISEILLPVATPDEQTAIAAFLDRETGKIDALIAEQEKLLALLAEKRQATISHAVTKGLNPDAPMKDSGVEWLGEVPEHWEVMRLKQVTASIKAGPFGSALTKDMYSTSGYRVYGQEQVIPGDFNIGDYYIAQEKFDELSQYEVAPSDILISCVGTFGKIAIVPVGVASGIINPRLMRLRVNQTVSADFLAQVLRSEVAFEQFALLSRGGTMDVINIGTLSGIVLTVPPRVEQNNVLAFIQSETARLDALTTEASRAIELLKERRTALISAAVTGKIDVRGVSSTVSQPEVTCD